MSWPQACPACTCVVVALGLDREEHVREYWWLRLREQVLVEHTRYEGTQRRLVRLHRLLVAQRAEFPHRVIHAEQQMHYANTVLGNVPKAFL
eukprot:9666010-Alexandrium_andersonii.AAC.1